MTTCNLLAGPAGPQGPAGTGGTAEASSPADPVGTNDATGVMMGLAGAVTPASSGTILITIEGTVTNNTNNKQTSLMIHTGTGAAPANGDPPTGTGRGITRLTGAHTQANEEKAFVLQALTTGLTPGTPYWIDIHLAAPGGGISSLTNLYINAIEL